MKKLLSAVVLAATISASSAIAATYKIDNTQANVYFYIDGTTYYNWDLSGLILNVDDTTKSANLSGNIFRAGSNTAYALQVAFSSAYNVTENQIYWTDFTGSIKNTATGLSEAIEDLQAGRGKDDARVGIDSAPYNPVTSKIELGFWAYNAGRQSQHDFNTTLTCTSSSGASGAANANGSCTTGAVVSVGSKVPLPGTFALLGLAALGLGARRMKLS